MNNGNNNGASAFSPSATNSRASETVENPFNYTNPSHAPVKLDIRRPENVCGKACGKHVSGCINHTTPLRPNYQLPDPYKISPDCNTCKKDGTGSTAPWEYFWLYDCIGWCDRRGVDTFSAGNNVVSHVGNIPRAPYPRDGN